LRWAGEKKNELFRRDPENDADLKLSDERCFFLNGSSSRRPKRTSGAVSFGEAALKLLHSHRERARACWKRLRVEPPSIGLAQAGSTYSK
jgi:hypothetical protein